MKIPTYIVEEHHEAFYAWNLAKLSGKVMPVCNTLYHFDEHSDMAVPRFNTSIDMLKDSIDEIRDFTYRELTIATFIVPAIYTRLIQNVVWVKVNRSNNGNKTNRMYVRSYNNEGKKLIMGKLTDLKNPELVKSDDGFHVEFEYSLLDLDEIRNSNNSILDIDLDYFSCAGNPNELNEIYIEITKDEYGRFKTNKYHRLNYFLGVRVETREYNGKYYYVINDYNEIYPSSLEVDESMIISRIDNFVSALEKHLIMPQIITICRSRYSGYTAKSQWNFIETKLVEKLVETYECDFHNSI